MREMTVLVSDIRGFTSATEGMEAPQVVELINRYLEKMTDIIVSHEGTIDEFTGDGILVFFGAPRLLSDHTRRAVLCALEMQESMKELNNENLSMGLPRLEMGIGINCGKLVVGNIGSEKRKKYGAVGRPIIVAFRLEEKTRPGEIAISQTVKERLGNELQIGSTWSDSLKGIGNTAIYQVIGMKRELRAAHA
jgi:sigma-B regulation protein RsbU (phosphoserine phosphatase)